VSSRVYGGRSARSRREPIVYSCRCGERFAAEIWRAVDTDEIDAAARLCAGTLNQVRCPACGTDGEVAVSVLYHDLGAARLVLVLPEAARHRELAERAELLAQLAEDAAVPTDYVLAPTVVFGAAALRAALGRAPAPAPAPSIEPVRAPSHSEPEPPRAVAAPARARVVVPDPRAALVERWIAGREVPSAFLVEDSVLVCAALGPAALEALLPGAVEVRVQLHRLPTYPVLTLALTAPGAPDEHRVLTVPLDIARAAHRVVLEALGRRFQLTAELYDHEYLPVMHLDLAGPLEENARRLYADARDALERLAPATRSFERARQLLASPGYDRLGRTPVDLPDEQLESLERPAAVRAALAAVARWSEPSAEAYLVEIRSLPLAEWRQLRARVIRRALDVGIAVPRPLVERSAKEHTAPLPAWPELLSLQLRRFAEVASRSRPNDLSAAEEAENWELLLRECALAGVVIDDDTHALAASSIKRARAGTSGGVDLRTLASAELAALLERRELRRDAAVILCERHEPQSLPLLFAGIRRMTRGEANVVLPAVTGFGHAAERWLVDGLRSKKSFMRQGCALALATLKTPLGVDALVKLLVAEPTEIWTEVARALGDVGAAALLPLAARLREVDAEHQERIIHTMAHIAARGAAAPVERLAEGRDARVAGAARKALLLAPEVGASDAAVRRGGRSPFPSPSTDETVVRGFTRRFYEALGGGTSALIELSASDLEEIDDDRGEDDGPTATDIVPVAPRRLGHVPEDPTNPRRKTSLPRER
jgi:hypothetical protein